MRTVIFLPRRPVLSAMLLIVLSGLLTAQADVAVAPRATFDQSYTLATTTSMRTLADLRSMYALPSGDRPIVVEGLPTQMRIGDVQTVTFRFTGDGVAARLAGAILFESHPVRDAIYYSAGKILADRSRLSSVLDVDVLPSGAANEVVWRITARRAGTAGILAVCASRVPQGPVATQVWSVRVATAEETVDGARPGVVAEPPPAHWPLYVGERIVWTGFARSLNGRLPLFDFAVLSLDGGCLEGVFSNSTLALRGAAVGRALVIGALGDDRTWLPFVTQIDVTAQSTATEPRLRGFVNNFVTLKNRRVTVLGDHLQHAAYVSLLTEEGAFLSLPFRAWSNRVGMFELPPQLGRYTVWLTDEYGRQITDTQTVVCRNIQVTNVVRVHSSAKPNAPTIGLFVRGQGFGDTPTLIVNGIERPGSVKKSLRGLLNQRVYFRLPAEVRRDSYVSVQVMNPDGYVSDSYLLDVHPDL